MYNNDELHKRTKEVILRTGDMIIDHASGASGFLLNKLRYIDMVEDDVYIWEVDWFKSESELPAGSPKHMEEEGLKLSIVVGTISWHSVKGTTFEPLKKEKI
jgi:hypothetical protein